MRRRYQFVWLIVILALALIAVRAALPSVVKDYLNDKLQAMKSYEGHVGDVHLAVERVRGIEQRRHPGAQA